MNPLINQMDHAQKVLVMAAVLVDERQSQFFGHATRWNEDLTLVLNGRKGLFDYSDEELDEGLELFLSSEPIVATPFRSVAELVAWARRLSRVHSVDPMHRSWTEKEGE